MTAVTGLPVRVYWGRLRGGSVPRLPGLFFRKLTGDGRVRALAQKCIAQAVSRVISGIMEIELLPETFVTEAVLLVCAFILSAVIGVEREVRQKSAGARTHILVGLGTALFTLVSAYGFSHLLGDDVVLDPSRIAAQIVSGIGFIGAGVIFVRQNIVSGLTTAASIWVTASVGMACGAGMPLIAALTVVLYLLAVTVVSGLTRRLPRHGRSTLYSVRYVDGRGVLRDILGTASKQGYEAALSHTKRIESEAGDAVEASMRFTRLQRRPDEDLVRRLSELDGVLEVRAVEETHD